LSHIASSSYIYSKYKKTYAWTNSTFEFLNNKTYKIYNPSTEDMNITIMGKALNISSVEIYPGWNWIGYPSRVVRTVKTLIQEPEVGDIILSQDNETIYKYIDSQSGNSWTDTTFEFEPNKGYKYYSKSTTMKTIEIIFD